MTTQQVSMNRNPKGKGGFKEHPENQSPGGWNPVMTFSYQYKFFNNMPVEIAKDWLTKNPNHTVIQEIAWNAVDKAKKEHKYLVEITNRTEGMPKQTTDLKVTGKSLPDLIEELETNYERLSKEIDEQVVETDAPVQDQGQAGAVDPTPAEPDPATPPQGEAGEQAGTDPQS